ncbi:hypothetical protein C8R45DRAFT_1069615 [Mycena sanguinolenta]|nr:hypothetical protein C8R45DRAFT_1069615 [Mycena sanguinolenta]
MPQNGLINHRLNPASFSAAGDELNAPTDARHTALRLRISYATPRAAPREKSIGEKKTKKRKERKTPQSKERRRGKDKKSTPQTRVRREFRDNSPQGRPSWKARTHTAAEDPVDTTASSDACARARAAILSTRRTCRHVHVHTSPSTGRESTKEKIKKERKEGGKRTKDVVQRRRNPKGAARRNTRSADDIRRSKVERASEDENSPVLDPEKIQDGKTNARRRKKGENTHRNLPQCLLQQTVARLRALRPLLRPLLSCFSIPFCVKRKMIWKVGKETQPGPALIDHSQGTKTQRTKRKGTTKQDKRFGREPGDETRHRCCVQVARFRFLDEDEELPADEDEDDKMVAMDWRTSGAARRMDLSNWILTWSKENGIKARKRTDATAPHSPCPRPPPHQPEETRTRPRSLRRSPLGAIRCLRPSLSHHPVHIPRLAFNGKRGAPQPSIPPHHPRLALLTPRASVCTPTSLTGALCSPGAGPASPPRAILKCAPCGARRGFGRERQGATGAGQRGRPPSRAPTWFLLYGFFDGDRVSGFVVAFGLRVAESIANNGAKANERKRKRQRQKHSSDFLQIAYRSQGFLTSVNWFSLDAPGHGLFLVRPKVSLMLSAEDRPFDFFVFPFVHDHSPCVVLDRAFCRSDTTNYTEYDIGIYREQCLPGFDSPGPVAAGLSSRIKHEG